MFTPAELLDIRKFLNPENKIVIITHYNPDGDAIGSSLGLKHFLKNKGLEAEVVVPNDFPKLKFSNFNLCLFNEVNSHHQFFIFLLIIIS